MVGAAEQPGIGVVGCKLLYPNNTIQHAGVITGFMNTLGNIGGMIGPLVVGVAVDRWHSWTFPFYITALVYAGGALAWLVIDPTTPIAAPAD